jgi:hypothetical protein
VTQAAASPADLLAMLDAGGRVTKNQLKRAITESQWDSYCQAVEFEKWRRADQKAASEALSDYTKLLKIADMRNGLFEKQNRKAGNRYNIKNSDALYERALERLGELLAANPSLSQHLDRNYDADKADGECSAGQLGVPRLKHHRRHVYGNAEHRENLTSPELVRTALLNSIAENERGQEEEMEMTKDAASRGADLETLRRWVRR